MAKHEDVVQLHADIKRDMGGAVDILVNNAGFMSLMSIRDGTVEELDRIIKINLYSHFYVSIGSVVLEIQNISTNRIR